MTSKKRQFIRLGERIASLRKAAGYPSQDEFAEKAKISISALKDIERGVSEGHIKTRKAIAKELNCTVESLYQNEHSITEDLSLSFSGELLTKLGSLSPVRRAICLYLISMDVNYLDSIPPDDDAVSQALQLLGKVP